MWLRGIEHIQLNTIKSYITHICSAHVDADLPFTHCKSPLLQGLISGIKQFMGKRECKPSSQSPVMFFRKSLKPQHTLHSLDSSTLRPPPHLHSWPSLDVENSQCPL